jgi:hypothetical protein
MISHYTRAAILASAVAASIFAAVPRANAESKFDGAWSVVIVTKSGPCVAQTHVVGQVIDGILHYAALSPSNFFGRVAPSGAVTVTASLGEGSGVASGRLSGSAGSGSWHLHNQSTACSGVWSAQRN